LNYKKIFISFLFISLLIVFFPSGKEAASQSYQGVALKDPTYVYESTSTSSKKLKGYAKGSILKYQSYNGDWYQATVYINGKAQKGFISKNDVENATDKPVVYEGIALKSPTNIYFNASATRAIKSYSQGSILKYQTFTSQWYKATVYINGKAQTGYIHKSDVENAVSQATILEGIGLKNPTNIYSNASRTKTIKSYPQGSILKYQTFTSQWYKATVYINGKIQTGYIHKSDVENAVGQPARLEGIGLKNPTNIYSNASRTKTIKSYPQGSILKYQTFTSQWYRATVYINGKAQTGYIHKSDVENAVSDPVNLQGIALMKPTKVFSKATTNSTVLKSYKNGTILNFKTFTNNWYRAEVYISGIKHVGYIYKSHVETLYQNQTEMQGLAAKSPTNVYEKPSTDSKVIKTYKANNIIKFKTFSPNWYEATVYVKNKKYTGYFYKKDIITGLEFKQYDFSLDYLVDKQMAVSPTTDLYGSTAYVATAFIKDVKKSGSTYQGIVNVTGTLNVRENPSENSRIVGKLSNGSKVTILDPNPVPGGAYKWYKIRFTWKLAKREDVKKYANPENFEYGTAEFYQFLNLAAPAGLDPEEVNAKILSDKGALKDTAQHFIDAAKKYGINEIYLMAHALLETGNGTSELAQGVRIKKNSNGSYTILDPSSKDGTLVYNFFGIGAYDSDPVLSGAIMAYEEGWTSIEKAIIGGAEFIGNDYIKAGQNTLYKMRWNPDYIQNNGRAGHQYATDIAWAVKQGKYFKQMYDLFDKKALFFEVPVYK